MSILNQLCKSGGVVFEGAQGTMLDVDHGTYPYVTSSTQHYQELFLEQV